MRRTTTTLGSASAAVLCLGVLLTGCGSAADKGYVAVGAAGPADGRAPTKPVPPRAGVQLTPLDGQGSHSGEGGRRGRGDGDGSSDSNRSGDSGATSPGVPGSGPSGTGSPDGSATGPGSSAPPAGSDGGGTGPPHAPSSPGGSTPSHGSHGSPGSPSPKPPSPTIPAGPDAPDGLLVGKPELADADVRWCQKVTMDFLNTGDDPVTAGTVTFGTHVIGALGIDWATLTSTHKLPLPLAPGKKRTGTWRVCVDAWRVPLGMHLDTKDVSFTWK